MYRLTALCRESVVLTTAGLGRGWAGWAGTQSQVAMAPTLVIPNQSHRVAEVQANPTDTTVSNL